MRPPVNGQVDHSDAVSVIVEVIAGISPSVERAWRVMESCRVVGKKESITIHDEEKLLCVLQQKHGDMISRLKWE